MKPSPAAGSRVGDSAVLPPVVEELLADLVHDGFAVYCCGDRTAPQALVASYDWQHYLDVVTIRNFDRITAARIPKREALDIFAPETVVWAYEGPPEQALRALLDLPGPPTLYTTKRLLSVTIRGARPPRRARPKNVLIPAWCR